MQLFFFGLYLAINNMVLRKVSIYYTKDKYLYYLATNINIKFK